MILQNNNASFFVEYKEIVTEQQNKTVSDSEVLAEIVDTFAKKLDILFVKRFTTAASLYDKATEKRGILRNECESLKNEIAPYFEIEKKLDNEILSIHKKLERILPVGKNYRLPQGM